MLSHVQVRGFKAIHDTQVVPLSPLTVFLGRNGSGKSSLLEALQWLQESLWDGLQAATQRRYVAFKDVLNNRSQTTQLDLTLRQDSDPAQAISYHIEVGASSPTGEVGVEVRAETCQYASAIEIRTGAPGQRYIAESVPAFDPDSLALALVRGTKATGAMQLNEFLRRAVFLRLNPAQIARPGPLALPAKGPLLDEGGANLPALLRSLGKEQRKQAFQHLRDALAGRADITTFGLIEDKTTQTGTLALTERAEGTTAFTVPAWVLSEGTRRLAPIYTLLALRPRPSLIAIEEIENGLDPWTLSEVLAALQQAADEGVQVLLTTHSPYFLDKLDPDQVIHVSRRDGESRFRRITSYKEVAAYEGTVPPGVMYLSNYFAEGDE